MVHLCLSQGTVRDREAPVWSRAAESRGPVHPSPPPFPVPLCDRSARPEGARSPPPANQRRRTHLEQEVTLIGLRGSLWS